MEGSFLINTNICSLNDNPNKFSDKADDGVEFGVDEVDFGVDGVDFGVDEVNFGGDTSFLPLSSFKNSLFINNLDMKFNHPDI